MKKTILTTSLLIGIILQNFAGPNQLPFINFKNWEFLVGLRGGVNASMPLVLNRYSVFQSTSDTETPQFKTYDNWFKNLGNQFGILLVGKIGETNYIMLQPSLTTHIIKYNSVYEWIDPSNPDQSSNLTYTHKQTLKYLEIPLIYRKELTENTLRPYLQGGVFYSFLQNATQQADMTETMTIGQITNTISQGNRSGNITSQYIRSHIGLMGGAGISYHFTSVIICLDGLYKFGLHNITNEKNRYTNQSIVGDTFDVPDDINLNAIEVSINIIFKIGNNQKKRALKCP